MENKNKMREIFIEKVILHCGAVGDKLDKASKLLNVLSNGKKIMRTKSVKRIPALGVRPGLELGCMTTLRGEEAKKILKQMLAAVENKISKKKIQENHFSFGIKEYIEIPGVEFIREVGILGLNITVVFSRKGRRTALKKVRRGKLPKRQGIPAEEIIEYMKKHFDLEVVGGKHDSE